jgi:hypothetical protein
MIARFSPRPNVCFMLLMIILTLPGCGSGISHYVTKPVQGSQNLSVDEITQIAGQSLQMMGYGIQEQDIPAGYIHARKRVVEDMYGRSTEIKINVQQGQVGEKVLGVEAFSCPGCIPEAHFNPSWMANQFYTFFDLIYKASEQSAGTKASPFAQSPPTQDNAGSILNSRSPPSAGKQPPDAEQPHPSLRINTMEVIPDVMGAGSKFNIVVEYTMADPTMKEKELPVHFNFSIVQGSEILYSSKSVEVNSSNGGGTKRTEPMTASKKNGAYRVKVILHYRGVTAEESKEFVIK